MFDFVIPKSLEQPERIVQSINNPKKDSAEALVFKWFDTKDIRSSESRLYALLNDGSDGVPSSAVGAFQNYDISPV